MKNVQRKIAVDPLILVSLVLFIFSLMWAAGRTQGVFWSLDEGGKYIYMRSILETGRLDTALIYPARDLDPNLEHVPLYFFIQKGSEITSWWPIALPLVSIPFYLLIGWLGLYLMPAAGGAAAAYLSGHLVKRMSGSRGLSIAAVVLSAAATPLIFYSTMFWEHTISTALLLGTLLAVLSSLDHPRRWKSVLAGVLASLAVWFRLDTGPILAGFGLVFLLRNWKQALQAAAGFMVPAAGWMALNQWTCGNPFGPNTSNLLQSNGFSGMSQVGLKLLPYALFNPPRADAFILPKEVLLVGSLLLLAGTVLAFWSKIRWLSLIFLSGVTGICAWVAFQPSQYQALHGIVLAAPQILFGLYWLFDRNAWKVSPFPAMLLAGFVFFAAVYIWRAWVGAGGLQWGPRYILSIYPLMTVSGLLWLYSLDIHGKRGLFRWGTLAFGLACLVGLAFSIRGLITARKLTIYYSRSIPAFTALDAPAVLTWEGFVMDVPELYWSGKVIVIPPDPAERHRWEEYARGLGYKYYYSGTLLTVDNAPLEIIEERLVKQPSGVVFERIVLSP